MPDKPRKTRTARDLVYVPLSIAAWTGSFALMLGAVALSAPVSLFVPFERFQTSFPKKMLASCLRLTGSRIVVDIDPAFDERRPCVYAHNHTSVLDAHIAVWAIPGVFCGLENEAHLHVPGYGWLLRMANAIPVPRAREGRYQRIAEAFKERASRGISILTFPEAHRTLDGKVRPFRRGVFFAARDAGLPVVPVAARGMYDLLPKGTWIVRPARIHTRIGPPIETRGLTDAQVEDLARTVQRIVAAWVERGEWIAADEKAAFEARVRGGVSGSAGASEPSAPDTAGARDTATA
ncbi:MAG: 1-acyl-sn-glycerol-3-phosphate acyltransferase [Deltaproteobacteria bacterium]|nr:MAG: 1-acyl-sn-glycerol-3-phosphate acyltransferase [Deltaproteobacteria bacterium]